MTEERRREGGDRKGKRGMRKRRKHEKKEDYFYSRLQEKAEEGNNFEKGKSERERVKERESTVIDQSSASVLSLLA